MKYGKWSMMDLVEARELSKTKSISEIAEIMDRSYKSVAHNLITLGIELELKKQEPETPVKNEVGSSGEDKQTKKKRRYWTDDEVAFLKFSYTKEEFTMQYICENLPRWDKKSIQSKASSFGLYRPKLEIPDGYKRCWKCKSILKVSEFYKSKSNKDGLDDSCKFCNSVEGKKHLEIIKKLEQEKLTKVRGKK